MKAFVFDYSRCSGCYACQVACKDEHCDNEWLPIAKPQPDTGQFWIKVHERTHGSTPKVKVEYWPTLCNHCENAPCVNVAKDDAVYRREDGLVIVDPVKAKGQKDIVDACPFNAIYWNEELELPQKCTGCAHLLDEGEEPRCVEMCATGALRFGDEEDFADEIAKADTMDETGGFGVRVYYLNAPKFFVAGTLFDEEADEIIEDATIYLYDPSKIQKLDQVKSDEYGDFWLKKVEPGTYALRIQKNGYKSIEYPELVVDKSINLGDLPMVKM